MIGVFLGATERLVHAQRHPRIALVDVVSDHHRVHDRVDLGASVVVLLDLGIVGEQPAHLGGAAAEGERIVRGHHEVDLAALEQVAELGAGWRLGEANVRGQLAAEAIGAALDPFDVARLDAILVLQQAAHVDRRRHRVFGDAPALALEVGRRLDPLAGAYQRGVVRQRHFRDFELVELQHAPENVGRLRGDVIQLDAFGLHRPVAERKRAVVGTACECQTQLAHRLIPRTASKPQHLTRYARPSTARLLAAE